MEITVINNRRSRSRIHVYTGDGSGNTEDNITTIKIAPGANLLKSPLAEAFDKARNTHPVVMRWFEDGSFEIKDAPSESKTYRKGAYVKDLSDLKPLDALSAVNDCKSVKDLKRWAHQDPRPQIQKAITARYDVLSEKDSLKDTPKDAQ